MVKISILPRSRLWVRLVHIIQVLWSPSVCAREEFAPCTYIEWLLQTINMINLRIKWVPGTIRLIIRLIRYVPPYVSLACRY